MLRAIAVVRILIELRIPLRGHLVNECHCKPPDEDDRRTTDEMTESASIITEMFTIPGRFLRLMAIKGNPKDWSGRVFFKRRLS